jgi:aspartyl-tRNA(Asn)/glutamyl-tRNA(Gln) amidotransferase subunit A
LLVMAERAIAQAAAADQARAQSGSLGALHGIPMAVKDLYEIAGFRTTAGSGFMRQHISSTTAAAVSRLEAAGAIMLGKLNLHEWALGVVGDNPHFGACHNPWDRERICGGSSSGSGAAVAAGLCMAALGSDTRGSIRIPAALCGVVGLKPTYGRISLRGVFPLSWHLDHAGTLTRTVADAALLLTVLAGYDDDDLYCAEVPPDDYITDLKAGVRGWRVAIDGSAFSHDPEVVSADVREAYQRAADVFASLGAELVPVTMAWSMPAMLMSRQMVAADAAAFHEQALLTDPDGFGADVLHRLRHDPPPSAAAYARLRREQASLSRMFDRFFSDFDVLLMPSVPFAAVRRSDHAAVELGRTHYSRFTSPFNMAGVPALSVPCGFSAEGLPLGVQIIGRRWHEAAVLRAGYAYEQATTWHTQHPLLNVS